MEAKQLIEQAEAEGFRLREHDGIFICDAVADPPPALELHVRLTDAIARNFSTVRDAVATRSQAEAAKERYTGAQCLILDHGGLAGSIRDASAGTVTVSFRMPARGGEGLNRNPIQAPFPADRLLLIVPRENLTDEPGGNFPDAGDDKKLAELLRDAEKLGLRFDYDDGLAIVRWPDMAAGDRDKAEGIVNEIGLRMPRLHWILRERARANAAKEFIGRRALVAGSAFRTGRILNVERLGPIISPAGPGPTRGIVCRWEDVMILPAEAKSSAAAAPEKKRGGHFPFFGKKSAAFGS
jgi:hypothetical protein